MAASGHSSEDPGGATQRLWDSVERSDEENLKEECSSTESTQQEVGVGALGGGRHWAGSRPSQGST